MQTRPKLICDTETYRNFWLCKFYDPSQPGVMCLEFRLNLYGELNKSGLYDILSRYTLITFNGIHYDAPIITYAMAGAECGQLKEASDLIIKGGIKPWEFYRHVGINELPYLDQIDIKEVLKGVNISLKKYGGRLHSEKLQDLPYHETKFLEPHEIEKVAEYCTNDLITTNEAYQTCKAAIELRIKMSEMYSTDLRSKSDAQMAEAILKTQLGFKPEKPYWPNGTEIKYNAPDFIKFPTSPYMQDVLNLVENASFIHSDKSEGGKTDDIIIPDKIENLIINIGTTNYKMGIGGLHSMEESVHYVASESYSICDADVTSYYPSLILLCNMYPKQLGRRFLDIYEKFYWERLKEKGKNDLIASCLKIVLNGTFGKLGSKYSIAFAPDLFLRVTLTGQLSLLMLIVSLEESGIKVISANTDGVVMLCPTGYELMRDQIIKHWERITGLGMEYTHYKAVYSRDVNNYFTIKPDGKVKTKGIFADPSMEKDPNNHICVKAVINYLKDGISIEDTIRKCTDIREFITVRYVKGGAVHQAFNPLPAHETKEELVKLAGFIQISAKRYQIELITGKEYTLGAAYKEACERLQSGHISDVLGKVVRYYLGAGELGQLAYATNGNKVPMSQGAIPVMQLPKEFPTNIDYDKYITMAKKVLINLGIK